MDKHIPLKLGQSAVDILKQQGPSPYTSSFTFSLSLPTPLPLPQLMSFLVLTYQSLTNHNPLCHYQILPHPTSNVLCDKHKHLALGGTFDHIHSGHYLLLTYASLLTEGELIVGITGEEMLKKKSDKEFVESFSTRERRVSEFLERLGLKEMRLFELNDGYGPTIVEETITGLVVTKETEAGGQKINQIRAEKGIPLLKVYVMDLIEDTDKNSGKVSSTTIRQYFKHKNHFENQERKVYRQFWIKLFQDIAEYKEIQLNQSLEKFMVVTEQSNFARYSQQWRFYHTNFHIYSLLKNYKLHEKSKALEKLQDLAIRLAIFYHDIIYVPSSQSNQEESAKLCENFLKQLSILSQKDFADLAKLASELILSTKKHQPSADNLPEQLLNDLDMGILDTPLETYKKYAEEVKQQYSPMFKNPLEFNKKRIEFLSSIDISKVFCLSKPTNMEANFAWQKAFLTQNSQL